MTPEEQQTAADNALVEKLEAGEERSTLFYEAGIFVRRITKTLRNPDGPEAAERIKSLLADRDKYHSLFHAEARLNDMLNHQVGVLDADRQRVREALEKIELRLRLHPDDDADDDRRDKRKGHALAVKALADLTPASTETYHWKDHS